MKTLLQINSVVNSGSTGHIAEELGQIVVNNGWNSYIACGRNQRASKSAIIKIGSKLDILLHGLQTRLFDRHGLGSRRATLRLVKLINKIKPDIIHLHNLHGYYINIEILFSFLASNNIPVVWTFHDCWPMTGHCTYFDYIRCDKWKTECFGCPLKNEYPASFGLDRSKKNYQLKKTIFNSINQLTIVTVSKWLGNIVQDSYLKNCKIRVINNGIDTDIFHPVTSFKIREQLNLENKFVILGVASIWSPRKGLADFIRLSFLLNSNFIIILVGLNDEQITNLPDNIIGISRTENQHELSEFYSIADIFVNPSVEETFGLTTVEALSCGTPAIVYNATACPEVLSEDTGFIIKKGDIVGLLSAIENVRKNGKVKYSNACRKRALELYDKNDRYLDYLNLYESLLNER